MQKLIALFFVILAAVYVLGQTAASTREPVCGNDWMNPFKPIDSLNQFD